MKKIILITLSLILLGGTISAQQDCPQVDCPGICGRFVDADGDGFCDHGKLSKPKAEPATPVQPKAPSHSTDTKVKSSEQELNEGDSPADTSSDAEHEDATTVDEGGNGTMISAMSDAQPSPKPHRSPYHVYSILIGTLLLYIASMICVKDGLYSKVTHRKIWNVLLTITFLVSCLLGLLLAIFLFHGYRPKIYISFLHLHVWFGIAMTLIALFHALWHWNYFKNLFKKKN